MRNGPLFTGVNVGMSTSTKHRQSADSLSNGSTGQLPVVINALRSIQSTLKEAGVRHAGVFGSTARNEYRPGSDIDILIDIDVARIGDILGYIDIADCIKKTVNARCPDVEVDVADHATLKPGILEHAERDVVYAF